MDRKESLSHIECVLRDHVADKHLQALVKDGCNRDELISLMELAFFADESWKHLAGMDLRAFKRGINQVRHCAGLIERLNRSQLVYHASIEIRLPPFVSIQESPTLPERLRDYASKLDFLRSVFGPKHKRRRHAWKAWIVAIVTEDTKKPHDPEVSSLIGAVLDESKYSEKAHQAWRLEHSDLIEVMREKLQQHRRKKGLQSIPK